MFGSMNAPADPEYQQIVFLAEPEGRVLAKHRAYGKLEADYTEAADGSIWYRNMLEPAKSWYVNRCLRDFAAAAAAFNRYCAGDGTERTEAEFLRDAARLKDELEAIEKPGSPDSSFWAAILEQIDFGKL